MGEVKPVIGEDVPRVQPCTGDHKKRDTDVQPLGEWLSAGRKCFVCPQCNGGHAHHWVNAVEVNGVDVIVCLTCGAPRCTFTQTGGQILITCTERKFHVGPHMDKGRAIG